MQAKQQSNEARTINAQADDEGEDPVYTPADLAALRLAVDMAALEARQAGCNIDDLVGPTVGVL